MRVGLIGAGRIGAFHAATLRDLPDVDSLVVADADAGLARAVAERLSARGDSAPPGNSVRPAGTAAPPGDRVRPAANAPPGDRVPPGGSAPPDDGVRPAGAARSAAAVPAADMVRTPRRVRAAHRVRAADSVEAALAGGLDAVVIAAATPAHAELIHLALDAKLPVFCEKPVAPDVTGTREVIAHAAASGVPLHVGFQRRFDAGYRALRDAVRSGRLGWLHTLRACTCDAAPPHPSYIPTSGGIFRDCAVHDFDAIRWVTGREVVEVYAAGANRGEAFFSEAGDVDTAAAVLTLDDGALATVTCARYNGAGYDVRLEAAGSRGSMAAGLDDRTPLASAQPDTAEPAGTAYRAFMDRFHDAYVAELRAFTELAAGRIDSPCGAEEALEALLIADAADLSRREHRQVRLEEVR